MTHELPQLGVGIGFREPLRSEIFLNRPAIDFLEITADHYLTSSTQKLEELEALRQHFTLVPHCLDLSIGSAEGVDLEYLEQIACVVESVSPPWFSDHISFTRSGGVKVGHLAPVPFTEESLRVMVRNVNAIRKRIPTPFILENITYNLRFPFSEMSEPEFISRLVAETGCGLLLDVTNLYINSINMEFDVAEYLDGMPLERVVQLHFVGSHRSGARLVDAHADRTEEDIWNVFEEVCVRCDIKGAILERDENFPAFTDLLHEMSEARRRIVKACTVQDAVPKIQFSKDSAGLAV